jgi:predicted transcriptional regulator YheO
MNFEINQLKPIADGIVQLLHPHAEAVIHDLRSGKIAYIANPISGRAEGDPSLIEPQLNASYKNEYVIGPYEKAGARGQRISSITSVLRDKEDTPIFLICINLDFSYLESALDTLESFIRPHVAITRPDSLFLRDWRESIKIELRTFVLQTGCSIEKLDAKHRLELVYRLYNRGLFSAKKAADQVAEMIGVSRATIYNDLGRLNDNGSKLST